MTFICRPANIDIWYIYIYIELEKKNKKKTSKKKFDVSTRDRRRAQWDFRGVLDESLFFV